MKIRFNIKKASKNRTERGSYLVWGGGARGRGVKVNGGKLISRNMAEKIARNYDDTEITYINPDGSETYRSLSDSGKIDTLRNILDIKNYPLPDELQDGYVPLTQEEQNTLDKTMETVMDTLNGTGIDIQITLPRRNPKYEIIPGVKQGENYPSDDNTHIAFMFPGMAPEKFVGEDATRFLQELELLKTVQPAIDAAAETYKGIIPVVCLDNGFARQ